MGKEIEDPCKALFLNLSIEVHDRKFFGKLFNKRDAFPCFINRMPYLDSDIPSEIFYALIGSHILCIARTATWQSSMVTRVNILLIRMKKEGIECTHIIAFLKTQIFQKDFKVFCQLADIANEFIKPFSL